MFGQFTQIVVEGLVDIEILKGGGFKIQGYLKFPFDLLCVTHGHFSQTDEISLIADHHLNESIYVGMISD